MRGIEFVMVAGVLLATMSPASGRVVDYSLGKAEIEAASSEQRIEGPISDEPGSDALPIKLEEPTAADHVVKVVSIYCQAYKIENPISALMQKLLPPAAEAPSELTGLTLRLTKGAAFLRCLGTADFKSVCKNEVKISGEVRFRLDDGSMATRLVTVDVEREGHVGGFCGNIARYTAIVSREAGIELLKKARTAYQEAKTAR